MWQSIPEEIYTGECKERLVHILPLLAAHLQSPVLVDGGDRLLHHIAVVPQAAALPGRRLGERRVEAHPPHEVLVTL